MKTNDNSGTTTDKTGPNTVESGDRRSKANYDVIMGKIVKRFQEDQKAAEKKKDGKFEGYTLNELNGIFGEKGTSGDKLKFTVIYAAVGKLQEKGVLFGTGAKKNEKFFLTEKEAIANKPEPRLLAQTKKNQPYTLEKLVDKKGTKTWTVIEGGKEKKEIQNGYDAAILVPGEYFRVMHNKEEGSELVITNAPKSEQKAGEPAPEASSATANPEPAGK